MGVLVDIVPNHVGRRHPAQNAWWWDLLAHGRDVGVRRGVRRRLGRPAAAGSGCRCSATTTCRTAGSPPRRSWTASCATTTTASRSRPGRPTGRRHGDDRDACTPASTTSWSAGGAADAELNYRRFFAVTTLAGDPGRGPEVFARVPRGDPALVRRGPRRRAAGRPPGRPARPRGLPRRPGRADRRRLRAGREDPRARRDAAAVVGDRRHHRVRRPRRSSTGCSPTRPARAPSTRWRPGCAAGRSTGTTLIHDTKRAVADGILQLRGPADRARGRRRLDAATADPRRARATRWPSCSPASRSTAPTCPIGARAPRRGVRRGPTAPTRPRRHARRCSRPCSADPATPAGAAVPADQRDGDGQGRRGQRVLPLRPGSPRSTRSAATRRSSALSRRRVPRPRWPSGSATGRTR